MQPVDLVKLKSIRTMKINKKRARVFEQMGLPIQTGNESHQKQHFISKRPAATSFTIDQAADTSGNLKPFEQNFNLLNRIHICTCFKFIRYFLL